MMTVAVWVFFVLGDSTVPGEPPAYVQVTASNTVHRRCPERPEEAGMNQFIKCYPHHVMCDSGWARQEVEVNQA